MSDNLTKTDTRTASARLEDTYFWVESDENDGFSLWRTCGSSLIAHILFSDDSPENSWLRDEGKDGYRHTPIPYTQVSWGDSDDAWEVPAALGPAIDMMITHKMPAEAIAKRALRPVRELL